MDNHFHNVANAFSRKAAVYDAFGENHEQLTRMRRKVYDHISQLHAPGSYLLELNAGTGLDAAQLVQRGFKVHATDLSPGMIAAIEQKIAQHNLENQLTAQQCSFTNLHQVEKGPFDGIYSNFGGLNCIGDLTAVTRHLPRLLKPGGVVTWVIMPPICPWEWALIVKDVRVATRRLRPGGITANVEGVPFKTSYFSVKQVRRAFGPRFQQIRLESLALLTPTADNKTFAVQRPRLYRQLVCWEDRLSHRRPWNHWGDFFIISMMFTD